MVVRIRTGKSIRGALSYNERKVAKNEAELIMASGFSCNVNELGFSEKLRRFQVLNERNPWVKTNTLHLSLNFPPEEVISNENMQMIALSYMERIGFGRQPFLVYRHLDANHPHIHIVTTTIQNTGRGISLHNIGKKRSEPARKAIEFNFGLITAETRKHGQTVVPSAIELLPAKYGKEETKHAITNIVGDAIRSYKFTSLAEFNIILRQMNIIADRGIKGSRMYQTGGLVYCLLDNRGYRIGQAIKASEIYGSTTLATLELKFAANAVKKAAAKIYVEKAVRSILTRSTKSSQFVEHLRNRNIRLHFDQDRLGVIQAVYFVDHRNKATYTNQELGIGLNEFYKLRASTFQSRSSFKKAETGRSSTEQDHSIFEFGANAKYALINTLLRPELGSQGGSGLIPKKKKKRRKGPSL